MMSLTGYLNAVVFTLCSVASSFALFQVLYFKHRQPLVTGEGGNKNVETFCNEPLNGFFPKHLSVHTKLSIGYFDICFTFQVFKEHVKILYQFFPCIAQPPLCTGM